MNKEINNLNKLKAERRDIALGKLNKIYLHNNQIIEDAKRGNFYSDGTFIPYQMPNILENSQQRSLKLW